MIERPRLVQGRRGFDRYANAAASFAAARPRPRRRKDAVEPPKLVVSITGMTIEGALDHLRPTGGSYGGER